METSQKIILDGHQHNNLVLQRLKEGGKEKHARQSPPGPGDKSEHCLGRIFREISLRNEQNALRMTMSGEIQRMSNLNKTDALCKFLVLAYSKMLFALAGLRGCCELEDVRIHTQELRKLNYIFRNCVHFNIRLVPLGGGPIKSSGMEKAKVACEEIPPQKQGNLVQQDKIDIFNKMDSLSNSVNDLKVRIKNYFSNNVQEEINVFKNISQPEEPSQMASSDSNTDLCSSDSSSLEGSNDGNSTNSEEETSSAKANCKNKDSRANHGKHNFRHRRSVETILFTGNKLENAPLVEFSPAPKYHSRSKTQNTNPLQHEELINNKLQLQFNGVILKKHTHDSLSGHTNKAQQIIESANTNQKIRLKSTLGGISPTHAPGHTHMHFPPKVPK